jgi:tetratricopeptide (TPR) repeat protein
LAAALLDDHRRAVECFGEAFKHDSSRSSFLLGAGLSFQTLNLNPQARKMLDRALAHAEKDAKAQESSLPIATRFALAMSCAKDQDWPSATQTLEPLLEHPFIKGSNKVGVQDVAQIIVAYLALAREKEKAAALARKYLKEGAHVGELLIGLVQAESGDYAGAAETLAKVYEQDQNPSILEVLVSCLLADAAARVLAGDLAAAIPIVGRALKLKPDHKQARKLDDALHFSTRLKNLDVKQLDKTITECEALLKDSGGSPHILRALAILYHRKAVQAEKTGKHAKDEWAACIKFWRKRLLDNDAYWDKFLEEYNIGKGKLERLKPDEVTKWRVELVKELIADHQRYAVHYIKKSDKAGVERHLTLIWEWNPDYVPPDNFLVAELQTIDEAMANLLEKVLGSVKGDAARKALGDLAATHWVNRAVDKANRAVGLREQSVQTANIIVGLANAMGAAGQHLLGEVRDGLRRARSLAEQAQGLAREARTMIQRAAKIAPKHERVKTLNDQIDTLTKQLDDDMRTLRNLCSQVGA